MAARLELFGCMACRAELGAELFGCKAVMAGLRAELFECMAVRAGLGAELFECMALRPGLADSGRIAWVETKAGFEDWGNLLEFKAGSCS